MTESLLAYELSVRLAAFALVFSALVTAERTWPRRRLTGAARPRWFVNLSILGIDILASRLVYPAGAVGMAWLAEERGWGLLNTVDAPAWLAVAGSVLLLDLAIYLQHVAFHHVPILWRLHRVHHADLDVDVTTGVRFHPAEILASLGLRVLVVLVLGPPVLAVLLFETLLNATSLFNHSNLRLPPGMDRIVRLVVVTPDMHRVHHSIVRSETNSNFGFNLPWWDRLFRTYRAQPEAGHDGMTIGLERFRGSADQRLVRLLAQPFDRE